MPTALGAQTGAVLILLAAVCAAVICGVCAALLVLLGNRRRRVPAPAVPPDEVLRRELGEINRRLVALERGVSQIVEHLPAVVQGVGIVRYNPFSEMGGSMSFSLALLDGRANGVVVSVLNNRDGSRVYGKPIEAGRSGHVLSGEEQQALALARGGHPRT